MIEVYNIVPDPSDHIQVKWAEQCARQGRPFCYSVLYVGHTKPEPRPQMPKGKIICTGHFGRPLSLTERMLDEIH